MSAISMMCVGGPYNGCIVDVNHKPKHGSLYHVDDWAVGPSTIPAIPFFDDANQTMECKVHTYTFVQFSGDGCDRWFLAFGTDRGMWVLDQLVQMSRRRTLGDAA